MKPTKPKAPKNMHEVWLLVQKTHRAKRRQVLRVYGARHSDRVEVRDPWLYHDVLSPLYNAGWITSEQRGRCKRYINVALALSDRAWFESPKARAAFLRRMVRETTPKRRKAS